MRRKFKVTVDGETFIVEVEEVEETRPRPQQKTKKGTSLPAEAPTHALVAPVKGGTVMAPLPGVVSEVRVSRGVRVERGAILLVLEAMKMENEIYAPEDGVVDEIHVGVGQQVSRGDLLVSIS